MLGPGRSLWINNDAAWLPALPCGHQRLGPQDHLADPPVGGLTFCPAAIPPPRPPFSPLTASHLPATAMPTTDECSRDGAILIKLDDLSRACKSNECFLPQPGSAAPLGQAGEMSSLNTGSLWLSLCPCPPTPTPPPGPIRVECEFGPGFWEHQECVPPWFCIFPTTQGLSLSGRLS